MLYQVVGTSEVCDTAPGELFYMDMDPVMEARLVSGGHIRRAAPDEDPRNEEDARRTAETLGWLEPRNDDDDQVPDEA